MPLAAKAVGCCRLISEVDHQFLAFWHQPTLHGCHFCSAVSVPSKPWMSRPACCRKLLGRPLLKTWVSPSRDHSGLTYLRPWPAFVRSGSWLGLELG